MSGCPDTVGRRLIRVAAGSYERIDVGLRLPEDLVGELD